MFNTFPMQTSLSFIGLILGNIPLLFSNVFNDKKFKNKYIVYFFISFFIGLFLIFLEKFNSLNLLTCYNNNFFYLFICGFIMSIGIVVPGISSSVILMLLGTYSIYIDAVSTLNMSILVPLGLGIVSGGLLFLKIIKYLFDNFYLQTFCSILGFTLGSVLILYPGLSFDISGIISVLLFVACFYIGTLIRKKDP